MTTQEKITNEINDELLHLGDKVGELEKFIDSKTFKKLSFHHQDLLYAQYNTMCAYANILHLRQDVIDEEEE